ncbi:hypothetical protein M752DRAFT_26651 [Aspergillus phoenicis ATCC 13157]|uniref:Uncharacterized protein n=1 Tax=Aspergillus phoenicis ATCC 13157 TaxID=1353007 RepID=A0A370PGT9_ASPPH|nr:hypothetical protein M752DRAFT_26651 [Aspergillus phoenicis ATCC 13157]
MMLRNDHIATPLRKASRMAAEHYTTGIGATLYKVHVEGGEVGLVGRQIATKPLIRFGQIVTFIITYSRCLSPDLPRHQLSDEPSRHPPFTSSTAPVVVQRAASCTVKYFVRPSGNGQRPDIMYILGRRNGDENGSIYLCYNGTNLPKLLQSTSSNWTCPRHGRTPDQS